VAIVEAQEVLQIRIELRTVAAAASSRPVDDKLDDGSRLWPRAPCARSADSDSVSHAWP